MGGHLNRTETMSSLARHMHVDWSLLVGFVVGLSFRTDVDLSSGELFEIRTLSDCQVH